MAIRSGFHRSVGEDRVYDAKFFADYFASFIGNGIFANPSTNLQVLALTNMTTVVKPGKGWINGWILFNDDDFNLVHDPADGSLKRIDRVVLRLDHIARTITIAIKKGANASVPVAPTLTRGIDVYELALADVLINNGTTSISQANITDVRSNTALCGYVAGVVQQLDTTTIFNQMLAALQEREDEYDDDFLVWSEDRRQEFDDWFATIQDILDANVAANLQNQIDALDTYVQNSGSYILGELDTHKAVGTTNAHVINNIVGLQTALNSKATVSNYTASLPWGSWVVENGGLVQTVSVAGILATDEPFIKPIYPDTTVANQNEVRKAWNRISKAVTSNGSIKFFCFEPPMGIIDLNLSIKVVR